MARDEAFKIIGAILVVVLLVWMVFGTGIGGITETTKTITNNVFETVTNTIFGPPTDNATHETGINSSYQIQILGQGNWNCLSNSGEINLLVNGDVYNTTKVDWSGTGPNKIYTNPSFYGNLGAIIIVDITIPNAIVINTFTAHLLDVTGDTFPIAQEIC